MNTAEFLQISSFVVPDREGLVCGDTRITYMEMVERTNKLANALAGLGLSRGDKLAMMAVNSAEYVEAYYACAKLGVTFVPLNYRAKDEELTYMVNTSEVSVLFVGERYLDLLLVGFLLLEHQRLRDRQQAGPPAPRGGEPWVQARTTDRLRSLDALCDDAIGVVHRDAVSNDALAFANVSTPRPATESPNGRETATTVPSNSPTQQ